MTRPMILIIALFALGACTVETMETQAPQAAPASDLPEQVVALAAPYQNIMTARLLPDDNCYWYEHVGPVETTLLPLRSREGRPICVQQRTATAAPAAAPQGGGPQTAL